MTRTKPTTFGSTLYVLNSESMSPPPVERLDLTYVEAGGWLEVRRYEPPPVELPVDFAIREARDVNLEDTQELAQFAASWGLPKRGLLPEHLVRAAGSMDMLAAIETPLASSEIYPVSLLRLHLQVLRAIGDVYLSRAQGSTEGVTTAWIDNGFMSADGNIKESEWLTSNFVNAALAHFPMRIAFGTEPTIGTGDFYSGAILQLVDAMKPDAREVRRCQNVNCGRHFTRQRGRSRYADMQHTRGVKYCSHRCAKAQSERDRRATRGAGTEEMTR